MQLVECMEWDESYKDTEKAYIYKNTFVEIVSF